MTLDLLQYYGFDWIAAIFTIFGLYSLGNKQRNGFLYNIIAITSGTVVCIMINSIPFVLMNVIVLILNIRGYIKWTNATVKD